LQGDCGSGAVFPSGDSEYQNGTFWPEPPVYDPFDSFATAVPIDSSALEPTCDTVTDTFRGPGWTIKHTHPTTPYCNFYYDAETCLCDGGLAQGFNGIVAGYDLYYKLEVHLEPNVSSAGVAAALITFGIPQPHGGNMGSI